ncbi:MAG: site-2 protease family protein [Cyanobacteria bacterium]|nr:site-2 protease family protein [Cyanobacteriota bacterium]MDA0867413.1 site-2 protease family protein [Cyanobacteriota bacterium]
MNGNLRVGNLFGIPFFVNVSWFFVLALTTLNFGGGLLAQFPGLGGWAIGLGLISGLLLFASVLLHELGHSVVAQQQGIRVNSITLLLFGGLASLEEEAKTPAGSFWIAVAGPLVSLALFALLSLVVGSGVLTGPLAAIVGLLAYINLALATFNMLPGLPLDGGNVLKAMVWKVTGKRHSGIRWASRAGQVIGWSAVVIGGLSVLGLSNIGSFWTLLIGWFLLQNAGRSAQFANVEEALSGLTAADAVLDNSPVINGDETLRQLADTAIMVSGRDWRQFLVKDGEGQLLGTVHLDVLKEMPSERWSSQRVRDWVQPMAKAEIVPSDQPLIEVINLFPKQGALAVTRANGTLVGLVEKAEIIHLLRKKGQMQLT